MEWLNRRIEGKGISPNFGNKRQTPIEQYGFQTILLNTPSLSITAKEWLASQPYSYAFSEYQMRWSEQPIEASDEVLIRLAKKSDAKLEVKLDVLAFGMDEEDARSHLERIKERRMSNF